MAYAHVDLVATAGQQNFAFTIPYLSQLHMTVFKNGTLLATPADWTFLNAQTVRLVVGANLNDIIRIRRTTPINTAIVDYANGAVLGEAELDATALQSLFAAQEVADSLEGAITQNEFLQWDAQNLPIINIPVSSIPSSAVRRDFADSQVAAAAASASAAASSASGAAGSASSASTSASTATTQASLATTARTAAETAETNAELAETNAETAEVNAELAETNAETAQTAAAGSAAAASGSASTATTQAGNAATSASNASTSASNASTSASNASSSAAAALASEVAAAASAAKLSGTSTTSLLIAVASKVFTTQSGKFFDAGTWVLCTSDADPTNYMHGQVTSYVTTTLTVNVTNIGGAGTFADWTIRVSGTRGAVGATGADGAPGADGSGTPGTTVVTETAFGQGSTAGVDATFYSRVDHTHGTPTNPVTAHEAAGDPHTQYMTSAEVDTSIATHAGLADPHTGYQKESEKDAASGYAGLTAGSKIQANAVETASITDANVTLAKIVNVATSKLLGHGDTAAGAPQEITLGTNLSMSGTTLNATGGGGGDSLIYEFW
jgi:chemotaxis protein histidine kinase CheA